MTATVPLLLAVTDDARIARPDFRERLTALLAAGCPAVWLRSPGLGARELLAVARDVAALCAGRGASLWIGDRADVARLVGAQAVQLPVQGLSIAGARRVTGRQVAVGRSVHSAEAAVAAAREGADHLVVGTVFESATHPGRPAGGTALVRQVREALDGAGLDTPLVAVGGITPARAAEAVRAGAEGVAAIRALWDAGDAGGAVRAFLDALRPRSG